MQQQPGGYSHREGGLGTRALRQWLLPATCQLGYLRLPQVLELSISMLGTRVTSAVYTIEISREIRAYRLLSYLNLVGK